MFRRILLLAIGFGVVHVTVASAQKADLSDLRTTAERSGFKSTSTYDDVVRFMTTVDGASPLVHYRTYGTTYEGRAMPMVVVGAGLRDASAAAVRATNRLRVHIQANVHAGEVEGKEAVQVLVRELAQGQHADWLRAMVLIITPIYNADGNERFSLTNRQRQNGPINGMGTRNQAQNMNLNRDFMKIDAPEARAQAAMFVEYDPHVSFDLHTSDGSAHGYFLTYSPPLHPNTSDAIMKILKDEWFPFVTKQVKSKHGWDMFYYGNVEGGARGRGGPGAGRGAGRAAGAGGGATPPPPPPQPPPAAAPAGPPPPPAWGTFEHVPRFHNNYVGLRNRFALLSEAYAYATFEDRIKATNYFMEEALAFASQHARRLIEATAAADREPLAGRPLATSAAKKSGGLIEILMGEVEDEPNPLNGAMMNRRRNVVRPEMMVDRLWFEPTLTEDVPSQYFVPANAKAALDILRAHGVMLRAVTTPVTGVEEFAIATNTTRPGGAEMGPHLLRTLTGSWQPAPGVTVPAGAWAVPMNQPLARLAFALVAPTSDDGLLFWNALDPLIGSDARVYPIARKK